MRQIGKGSMRRMFRAMWMCMFLFLVMGAGDNPGRVETPGATRRPIMPGTPEFDAMIGAQFMSPSNVHDMSLAKRENVDFLLTAALLVQEAVSDGVVLTYPEE